MRPQPSPSARIQSRLLDDLRCLYTLQGELTKNAAALAATLDDTGPTLAHSAWDAARQHDLPVDEMATISLAYTDGPSRAADRRAALARAIEACNKVVERWTAQLHATY